MINFKINNLFVAPERVCTTSTSGTPGWCALCPATQWDRAACKRLGFSASTATTRHGGYPDCLAKMVSVGAIGPVPRAGKSRPKPRDWGLQSDYCSRAPSSIPSENNWGQHEWPKIYRLHCHRQQKRQQQHQQHRFACSAADVPWKWCASPINKCNEYITAVWQRCSSIFHKR